MGILGKRKAGPKTWRRKKRVSRAMPMATRRVRSTNNAIHSFKRFLTPATITGNVAYAPYQGVTNVTLSSAINSSDFVNLFDQYRIQYVVMKFWLRVDPSAQTAATASYPRMYWCRDKNSSAVLSQTEMRERGDCRIAVMNPNRPVTLKFKPNLLNQVLYSAVGTSSYEPVYNRWIDTSSASTFYYGCLWNIDDLTNTNYKVDIETVIYLQCKNTK